MAKSTLPPRFKPFSAPRAIALERKTNKGLFRTSPRDRGYDAKWDRLALAFRKQHPFCRFCEQNGRDQVAELVDHIIPVQDREDLKYDWKNLQPLCRFHHGRLKLQMEIFARNAGRLAELPAWCADPAMRPQQFRSI